jgi:putative endonuclease
MPFFVYVLVCKNGAFYTGCTQDVEARLRLHKKGGGARYVRMYPPKEVVYVEKFETRSIAMKRERQIKHLTHSQKQKLIGSKHENTSS